MYTLLTILLILIAVLIILIVLIQPGKGDMMSGMGTIGGSITSMFGTRKASNLLTKTTISLTVALMLLVIVTNKFFVQQTAETNVIRPVTEGVILPPPTQNTPVAPIQPQAQPQQPENNK